ncbi:MAG: hypothetical protein EZS28_007189 [Streblomastix strix]|uniref:RRM domain-containing protein n=1 Tax=Streblomastix strix TaxID=222440 RepID=A0A5J4WR75_9EUKA|nr:MAG: hypothetical protein EZS28_007189 [Streblomastix strix]
MLNWAYNLLNIEDDFLIWNALRVQYRIVNIVNESVGDKNPNPLREQFEKNGTMAKLFKIIQNESNKDKINYQYVVMIIGYLFKAVELPDGIEIPIIKILKELTQTPYIYMPTQALVGLAFLAESQEVEEEGKPNPLREEMEKDGCLKKLLNVFNNTGFKDKEINSNAAISIGYLFKAIPIPIEYGSDIINHLKIKINHLNPFIVDNSLSALISLAQCQIHITNIPVEMKKQQFLQFPQRFGQVKYMYYSPFVKGRAHFADVEYETHQQAESIARSSAQQRIFGGVILQVRWDMGQNTIKQKEIDKRIKMKKENNLDEEIEDGDRSENNAVNFQNFKSTMKNNEILKFVSRFGLVKKFLIHSPNQQEDEKEAQNNKSVIVEYINKEGLNEALKANGSEFEGCKLKTEQYKSDIILLPFTLMIQTFPYKLYQLMPLEEFRMWKRRKQNKQLYAILITGFPKELTLNEFFDFMDNKRIEAQGGFVSEEVGDTSSFAIAYFNNEAKLQDDL